VRLHGLAFVGLVVMFFSSGLANSLGRPDLRDKLWMFVGLGVVSLFFVSGLVLRTQPARFEFDRGTHRMRICRLGGRQERPLQQLLAVQVVTDPPRPRRTTYQLNLVLEDDRPGRLNLSNHSNCQATREAGAELARFLGVPFLDESSAASGPATTVG
jgi:hypothetical protein